LNEAILISIGVNLLSEIKQLPKIAKLDKIINIEKQQKGLFWEKGTNGGLSI